MNMTVMQPVNGTPVDANAVSVETRIAQYVAVRDLIKETEERHKKELERAKETLELLNGWLLQYLERTGSESVKTASGTVYASTRYTASLADPDAFMKYVISTGKYDLVDRRANATAVKDFVQENGSLPPGVNLNGIKTAGVRRAS